jgi:hypothetical protein
MNKLDQIITSAIDAAENPPVASPEKAGPNSIKALLSLY